MTRHPKGKNWTIRELDTIPPEWSGDILSDGGGLRGEVRFTSKVTINFKYQFRRKGKMHWYYCGTYPDTDLAAIRDERNRAKTLVKQGIDPRQAKKAETIKGQDAILETIRAEEQKLKEAFTFSDLFSAWIKDGVSRSDENAYLIRSFNKYSAPSLGAIQVNHLTEHHLRDLYRSVIAKGNVATAIKLSTDIGQLLRWAEKRKPWRSLLVDGNPAELVEINKLVPAEYDPIRTRYLSIEEIYKLKQIFDSTENDYESAKNKYEIDRPLKMEVQVALWICLGTLCRIGELLLTKWKNVNFEERTWFIPAADTKDEAGNQLVYLSDFTLSQFKKLYSLTGEKEIISKDGAKILIKNEYAFPAKNKEGHVCLKSVSKQVGDRQVKFKSRTRKLTKRVANNSLVLGDEDWTPHDMRRTGATLMQKLKINRDVINLCQNHTIGTKVDRSYLLDDYADEKRDAWYKLGDRIEAILSASNVVSLKSA
jgi:integrase